MAKNVTLADIAAQVGVSVVAVSKALSGKPGVSEELRQRIKDVAAQLGYISNTSKAATGNIGVIVPENYYGYSLSFYGRLYELVVKALAANHYYGILELLSKEDMAASVIPHTIRNEKVDGLIFLGQLDAGYIQSLIRQIRLPYIFLDTYAADLKFDTVISDGYYGMYTLTNYLIQKGHRKLAFVGTVDATCSIADRYWGYRRALREHGITFLPKWEIPDREIHGAVNSNIITELPDADAFVCNCDDTAYIVIQNLQALGCSVPEDVSVVGFDNFLPHGTDNITSYAVDLEQMAAKCVDTLLKKMAGKPYLEGVQIVTGYVVEKETVSSR